MRHLLPLLLLPLAACATIAPPPQRAAADPPARTAAAPAGSEMAAAGYDRDDILRASDAAFGDGARDVAKVVERVFADLGRPNAYIVGREGSGAVGVGLRYGTGTLHSKVEGERAVHWAGPSIGFDVGGDASRTFMLVYNLDDGDDIFQRFPAVEGRAYLVGGVSAGYHQRGRVILVPIRLGAGWRLGANVGYLRFTRESRVLPF